ncbi:hypothetical protein I7I51_02631 [Histoplasma capsulatum]|uniref:Uncharacterized protein n=1 Tax=Ajellomyces capsulatus TaxID=5037 RepID=A0A8A1M8N5_AJECA|nr:hypothetical protein I7I51_02631 [Histoplasma capsulatum]
MPANHNSEARTKCQNEVRNYHNKGILSPNRTRSMGDLRLDASTRRDQMAKWHQKHNEASDEILKSLLNKQEYCHPGRITRLRGFRGESNKSPSLSRTWQGRWKYRICTTASFPPPPPGFCRLFFPSSFQCHVQPHGKKCDVQGQDVGLWLQDVPEISNSSARQTGVLRFYIHQTWEKAGKITSKMTTSTAPAHFMADKNTRGPLHMARKQSKRQTGDTHTLASVVASNSHSKLVSGSHVFITAITLVVYTTQPPVAIEDCIPHRVVGEISIHGNKSLLCSSLFVMISGCRPGIQSPYQPALGVDQMEHLLPGASAGWLRHPSGPMKQAQEASLA